MALRIKSRWHDDEQNRSIEEIAGALAFIIWRIAKDKAINLHGQDYVYESDQQRMDVIGEYLIFQLQIVEGPEDSLMPMWVEIGTTVEDGIICGSSKAPGVEMIRVGHMGFVSEADLDDVIIGCAMPEAEQGLNVARIATLLAEDGREMHKSWGNAIEFNEAADQMGVDVMRWLYCAHKPENNLPFGYNRADEVRRSFLIPLWNVYSFFSTYANLDGWTPTWGAARPMPLAAYMLRSMSRASSRTDSSTLLMRLAGVRSTASPRVRIAIGASDGGSLGTCTVRLSRSAVRAIWAKLRANGRI